MIIFLFHRDKEKRESTKIYKTKHTSELEPMKKIKIIGIIAVVVGLLFEIFMVGSNFSLGTIIAGGGIIVYVYAFFQKPPKKMQ